MAGYARVPSRRRGRFDVIWALSWADENALSPQEVWLRMTWRRVACWPAPLCNPTILDLEGRFVGVPDLLDVATGVAGEFCGAEHAKWAALGIRID